MEVRDYGPGLPTDENDALFERFWRAEAGRKQGKAGAGLGLAIVAGIVAAHDGSVRAENAPGGGARFTVSLPPGGDRSRRRRAVAPEADRRGLDRERDLARRAGSGASPVSSAASARERRDVASIVPAAA